LSPHLDDAAFSCGGSIALDRGRGRGVLVLTVFAGMPELDELGAVARALHEQWSVEADSEAVAAIVEQRRREDQLAMNRLNVDFAYLDHPDCIYRRRDDGGWRIEEESEVFAGMRSEDAALVQAIAASLATIEGVTPDTEVLAPLAIGRHCDHEIVRAAAERWSPPRLSYYEDFPYVVHPGKLVGALVQPEEWEAELCYLDEEQLSARMNASEAYASQLPFLFGDRRGLRPAMRAYARECGVPQGGIAERHWRKDFAIERSRGSSMETRPRGEGVARHGLPPDP
jgi:LmbE family N-acetylglucosaminyl deacetylase